jgi:hypothetical protein
LFFPAAYKYTYAGNNLITIYDYDPSEGSYTKSDRVIFSFTTINGPLQDQGLGGISGNIAGFTFADGRQEISDSATYLSAAQSKNPGSWKASLVPIPGAIWFLGFGLICLAGIRRNL